MQNCYRKWMNSAPVNQIFTALNNNARFVGGVVRDAILGIDSEDIDIVTPMTPDNVISTLNSNNIKVIPTGIKHGTVTAVIDKHNFEITTLRKDIECHGRHAQVEFTDSWEEDASRRDFTINAMSCTQNGDIYDYFNGIEDLSNKILRFVGNPSKRCQEDYLRILRFFRFFAKYGKEPANQEALTACGNLASGIQNLSGERIQTEMLKLLSTENPTASLKLMLQYGILEYIIPGTKEHNISLLNNALEKTTDPILKLALLLQDNYENANHVAIRWKMSNQHKSKLMFLTEPKNRLPGNISIKNAKKLARKYGTENFNDLCLVGSLVTTDEQSWPELLALKNWPLPVFPLKGKDLLSVGFKKGKSLGKILEEAENWWENQDYNPNKQEILHFVEETFPMKR